MSNVDIEMYASVTVDQLFNAMDEGARCHMANKLYKEGYIAIKAQKSLDTLQREFDIVEGACDFWKQEAINRGYEE